MLPPLMRKARECNPTTTSVYHLRFLVGDWVPDLSDEEKSHLRDLFFTVARALLIEIIDYAITPRGLEVIAKVPPHTHAGKLRSSQLLHLISLLMSDYQFRSLSQGLDHPVPRLRASYAARVEQHRGICCDLSAFGKILAQSFARWWKIRNPGKQLVWRDRFWSQLLTNRRADTIAASAAIQDTLRAHGIRPADYPWHAAVCPPPEPQRSIRAIPEFHPAPETARYTTGVRKSTDRRIPRAASKGSSIKERILKLLPEGHTQTVIAAKVGCSRAYVSMVKIQVETGEIPAKTRPKLPPKPLPAPAVLSRKQTAVLREALTTKLPRDFELPAGGFSQPWNRINAALLCRTLFGMRLRPSNLDALLVAWKITYPTRARD